MTHRAPASIPKGRWRDLWADALEELSAPTRSDARLLERLVLNLIAADAALKEAAKEPYVRGSQNQRVEHPGFKVAARCDGQALSIARQLRLTPIVRISGREQEPEEPEGFDDLDETDELAKRREKKAA